MNKEEKLEVQSCLEEIEIAYDTIDNKELDSKQLSKIKNWIAKQKKFLKELGHNGEVKRKKKRKKKISKFPLFILTVTTSLFLCGCDKEPIKNQDDFENYKPWWEYEDYQYDQEYTNDENMAIV
jgi:hypothetical protein